MAELQKIRRHISAAESEELLRAFAIEKDRPAFERIMEWIKKERDALDEDNREVGSENRVSGAKALSAILKAHAAAKGGDL